MNRDGLLWSLGRQARETDPWHDPRWDALAAGALSSAEATALERQAMLTAEGRDLLRAFRPLDDAACDRIAERTIAVLARQSVPGEARQSPPRSASRFPRAVLPLAAVLAVAAAAMGLVVGLQRDPVPPVAAQPTPMVDVPDYRVEVTGGDVLHATRAAAYDETPSRQPTLLGAGASVTVTLRPDRPAHTPVQMVACVLRDGRPRPWSVPWERSEQGSFHTQGTRESLFGDEPPGELTLLFAVRPPGALPTCDELAASKSSLHHTLQIR